MTADPRQRSVGIILTRSCNLSCEYCYQDRTSRERLAWPVLRDRLRGLLSPGLVELTFSGGEPLLEYPLIQKTVKAARSLEFGFAAFTWQLLTNGLLLDSERLEWLRSERFKIQLSLQADPRRPEAMERSLEAMRTIQGEGGFLPGDTVTITVVPGSSNSVLQALHEAVAAGAPEVSMSPDLRPGQPAEESEDEWFDLLSRAAEELTPAWGAHPVANFRPGQSEPGPCSAATASNVTIDTDGTIWTCEALIGLAPETCVDPNEGPQGAAVRLDGHRMLTTAPEGPHCEDCAARHSCRLCPATKLAMDGRGPGDFYCSFVRALDRTRATLSATTG